MYGEINPLRSNLSRIEREVRSLGTEIQNNTTLIQAAQSQIRNVSIEQKTLASKTNSEVERISDSQDDILNELRNKLRKSEEKLKEMEETVIEIRLKIHNLQKDFIQ
jgi:chromosome segregation ATPase